MCSTNVIDKASDAAKAVEDSTRTTKTAAHAADAEKTAAHTADEANVADYAEDANKSADEVADAAKTANPTAYATKTTDEVAEAEKQVDQAEDSITKRSSFEKASCSSANEDYTDSIKWWIHDVEVRPEGKGFWGTRIKQSNPRVDAFELKINPNMKVTIYRILMVVMFSLKIC